jgi:hypothetical protein
MKTFKIILALGASMLTLNANEIKRNYTPAVKSPLLAVEFSN